MRTTIDLTDDLFRRAKATAAMRGLKFKEFVAQSLEATIQTPPSSSLNKMPSRSPLPPPVRPPIGLPIAALSNAEIEEILTLADAKFAN